MRRLRRSAARKMHSSPARHGASAWAIRLAGPALVRFGMEYSEDIEIFELASPAHHHSIDV